MSQGLKILATAEALAGHAAARTAVIARNVAHADTPGYRAADLEPFETTAAAARATDDAAPFTPRVTRPGHRAVLPEGGAETVLSAELGAASPNGNTVSLEDQMVRAAETRLDHELALGVWRKSLDILRASLGAPR
jgi:flagellar basal-body rod protein FlgB